MAFYERHVCRVVPFPPEVNETFDADRPQSDRLQHDERAQ